MQDAVLRVQHRLVMAVPDTKESTVLSRLLVASNQTGCLLGKGGSIIAEMRKLSGAHIRILGREQIPRGVLENDEVVQVCFGLLLCEYMAAASFLLAVSI